MTDATREIKAEQVGIGQLLAHNRMRVPVNQREYYWTPDEVEELFTDLNGAIRDGTYFLGSVVVTKKDGGILEVADGQQRLATVTILFAAIRDAFIARSDKNRMDYVEGEFLSKIDPRTSERLPKLTLNVDDNEFFKKAILSDPKSEDRKVEPTRQSHRRILKARELARKHVQDILRGHSDTAQTETLLHWVEFVRDGAQVVLLTVPDQLNAFRLFETMNDRGADMAESDLLKNYLLGEAKSRLAEAQHKWSAMAGTIESVGEDDLLVTYLRHLLVTRYGAIRKREVYGQVKDEYRGASPAVRFLDDLAENATYYVALLQQHHPFWSSFGSHSLRIRRSVETLRELNAEQIRPLMLAVVRNFSPTEVEKAFRLFISWTVRFAVAGAPTGTFEKYYAARAVEIAGGEIKTAAALAKAMAKYLPTNETFRSAFANLRVSKAYFARYLLRSLEQKVKKDPEPEFVVNDDQTVLTLEHVLPQHPSEGWEAVEPDQVELVHKRLGNMVLLRASANSTLGTAAFEDKKKAYKASSTLELTKQVLRSATWGPEEIAKRQAKLAEVAVETWPLTI